ncbi:Sulfotransferase 1C4 [Armadillidium vulgare]|nr:Sulfotransferase 1C4 [Armadillidium vulgare]
MLLRHWIIGTHFLTAIMPLPFLLPQNLTPKETSSKGLRNSVQEKIIMRVYLIHTAAALPDPRLIKGHRPLSFWPPNILDKAKVIYLARDPRDVVVSCYYFYQSSEMTKVTATLDEFVDDFMDSIVLSAYWEHVRLAWEKRNNPNFLFLFYEDLKENPNEQIKKVDQFIGTNRSQNQIENVANYTSFNSMKKKSKRQSSIFI